jgi:hypothetical protein
MFKVRPINRFSHKGLNRFRINQQFNLQTDYNDIYNFRWVNNKNIGVYQTVITKDSFLFDFPNTVVILEIGSYLILQIIKQFIPMFTININSFITIKNETTEISYLCDLIYYGQNENNGNAGNIFLINHNNPNLLFPAGTYSIPSFKLFSYV